ncbi:MAG: U32 family peptidase C-terminal domain-containing protein, partial [Peptoniphilus sp.]|nr:U32 family peptidase C-terminal domain-containing protein [Peptoniphilus sp.]
TIEQRNRVFKGDVLEIFGPKVKFFEQKIDYMTDDKDLDIDVANKAKQIFKIKVDKNVAPGYFIRKKAK